jgi:hypothetical protein
VDKKRTKKEERQIVKTEVCQRYAGGVKSESRYLMISRMYREATIQAPSTLTGNVWAELHDLIN